MIGTLINTVAVLLGGSVGCACKKALPASLADTLMKVLGVCVLYLGVTSVTDGGVFLVVILSLVCGVMIGETCKLDDRIHALGDRLERSLTRKGEPSRFANAFVTATLLFCVGAMSILGPLKEEIAGDRSVLLVKSLLDGISALIFASTLGVGVLCSAGVVLLYQGTLALLSGWIAPFLMDNAYLLAQIDVVGGLLLIALSLNMMGLTQFKVMNMVPAVLMPLWLCALIPQG